MAGSAGEGLRDRGAAVSTAAPFEGLFFLFLFAFAGGVGRRCRGNSQSLPCLFGFSSLSHCSACCCLHGRDLRPSGASGAEVTAGLVAWACRATAPRVALLAPDAFVIRALSGARDHDWSVWRGGGPCDGVSGGQGRPHWWPWQGCCFTNESRVYGMFFWGLLLLILYSMYLQVGPPGQGPGSEASTFRENRHTVWEKASSHQCASSSS